MSSVNFKHVIKYSTSLNLVKQLYTLEHFSYDTYAFCLHKKPFIENIVLKKIDLAQKMDLTGSNILHEQCTITRKVYKIQKYIAKLLLQLFLLENLTYDS